MCTTYTCNVDKTTVLESWLLHIHHALNQPDGKKGCLIYQNQNPSPQMSLCIPIFHSLALSFQKVPPPNVDSEEEELPPGADLTTTRQLSQSTDKTTEALDTALKDLTPR